MDNKNYVDDLKSVAFRLTDLCNLDCVMCGQSKLYDSVLNHKDHYLPLSELKNIIDQVAQNKPQIYLWGGEPLIYPHFKEFIEYLYQKKLNVFVTTNGVLLEKYVEDVVKNKVAELAISLDGPKNVHESIRGRTNIFDKIIYNLVQLKKYKKENNKVLPIVDIHIVVVKQNYKYLYDFVKYLSSENLCRRVRIQFPMFFNKEMTNEFTNYVGKTFETNPGIKPSYEGFIDNYSCIDIPNLTHQLDLIQRDFKNVIIFPKNIDVGKWYNNPRFTFKNECLTCFKRINIEPNGDVITCTDFPETRYGNVLQDSIYDIYNNQIIQRHRENIDVTKGICPRCSYLYVY